MSGLPLGEMRDVTHDPLGQLLEQEQEQRQERSVEEHLV